MNETVLYENNDGLSEESKADAHVYETHEAM